MMINIKLQNGSYATIHLDGEKPWPGEQSGDCRAVMNLHATHHHSCPTLGSRFRGCIFTIIECAALICQDI